MKHLLDGQKLDDIVQEKPIVVIEIGSICCCACSAISQKLETHFKEDEDVVCYSVSLEAQPEIAANMGIYSAPAVLVYVEGQLTIREAGVMSVEDIFARIARYEELLGSAQYEDL